MEPVVGEKISHYEILARLGEGGMGVVFKAQDLRLNRYVALKFLRESTLSPSSFARLEREAKTISSLNHKNIATIYDIDEVEGRKFIVFEYLARGSLKQRIASEGSLSIQETRKIAHEIAEGLQHAHSRSIVHRDIKSDNVMFGEDGTAKVTDFGISRIMTRDALTTANNIIGTLGYMSPEQVKGVGVDFRSDLWSLGVVVYEMLTGMLPFTAAYPEAILYEILNTEPRSIVEKRGIAYQDLDLIVNKALRKDPRSRFQSAAEVVVALDMGLDQTVRLEPALPKASDVGHGTSRYSKTKLVSVVVLAVIATGIFLVWRSTWSRGISVDTAQISVRELPVRIKQAVDPAISRDGKWVVYAGTTTDGNQNLFIQPLDWGDPRQLTFDTTKSLADTQFGGIWWPIKNLRPKFSSDGATVYYEQFRYVTKGARSWIPTHEIRCISLIGSGNRAIAQGGDTPTPSPRGPLLAFEIGNEVWVSDSLGEQKKHIWSVPDKIRIGDLAWNASATEIAVVTSTGLQMFTPNGDSVATVPLPDYRFEGLCWSSSGNILLSSTAANHAGLWILDPKSKELQSLALYKGIITSPAIDQAGRRLICGNEKEYANLFAIDLKTGKHRQLTFIDGHLWNPRFSPDGKKLFYHVRRDSATYYVSGPEGEDPVQMTIDPEQWVKDIDVYPRSYPRTDNPFHPRILNQWSPDHKYARLVDSLDDPRLVIVRVDAPAKPLVVSDKWNWFQFCADSKHIVFYDRVSHTIWRVSLSDGHKTAIRAKVKDFAGFLFPSTDGSQVVCRLAGDRSQKDIVTNQGNLMSIVKFSLGKNEPEKLGFIPEDAELVVPSDLSRLLYALPDYRSAILVFENCRL